jgi:uncharacterized protein
MERDLVNRLSRALVGKAPMQLVLGPRQVGKTTAVEQLLARWKGPSHYASADLPAPPQATWISAQWETARLQAGKQAVLLALDEVQKVPRWSEVVKAEYEQDRRQGLKVKAVLLGSSSLHLDAGATESLAGRFERHFVPHWSFAECEQQFGMKLDEWLFYGGYPGANALRKQPRRWAEFVSTSLIESVLGRDVLQLAKVAKPALLRQLFMMATRVPSQVLAFNKMLGQLSDAGNTVTLASYLELLGGAFLLSGLNQYSGGVLRYRASSPKLVFWNNALFTAVSGLSYADARADGAYWGRVVENAVGAHLLNRLPTGAQLSYFRDGNAEVDFVLERGKALVAFEVKSGAADSIDGLEVFSRRYPKAKTLIIGDGGVPFEAFFRSEPEHWLR